MVSRQLSVRRPKGVGIYHPERQSLRMNAILKQRSDSGTWPIENFFACLKGQQQVSLWVISTGTRPPAFPAM
jgi:hypothetical protein